MMSAPVRQPSRYAIALAIAAIGANATAQASAAASNRNGDRAAAAHTYTAFLAAFADGNGTRTCSLMTASGQRKLTQGALPGKRPSCKDFIANVSFGIPNKIKLGLRTAVVKRVTLQGNLASIRDADVTSRRGTLQGFFDPKDHTPTRLVKTSSGWKITA
jgi:hypothetical protein